MSNWLIRIAFLALVVGGGILIGTLTAPGEWYAQLSKPAFNPPNWIFGPVWTVLYVLIALVGWHQFETDRSSTAMKLWWAQMGLNFLWSPTFFVLQLPWFAFVVIVALLAVIVMFIAQVRTSDRVSALAFLPYFAWVAFATALNLSIAILN
ncbi:MULTISPECIES: TspO/MBR family protein [unclassified Ruegeria]|uniref:TspO/MBR family protein n=1 Tax=unclassified Ruegeria TaxID=2625375 RepID=UPI001492DE03|nr:MULTISPECIES: TspO/MBR family protein [unclassified Ruegeria]NOD78728.1 tryptophan-rich sensory protein [Ruegeria sp. HKCCD4332]NOD91121.1 tryptophan-rich sensory protein [Ruegeria sp. HKCCD4318]NOE16216.1 tryptophan-rich sensory protein [Ruegeria sp. HKCCD4318-2]NOG07415.1 tryptophan-rich sensory protein [Ruegeria sp. HKCCD4315]